MAGWTPTGQKKGRKETCVLSLRLFPSYLRHLRDSDTPPVLQIRKLSPWEVGPLARPLAKGTWLARAELI